MYEIQTIGGAFVLSLIFVSIYTLHRTLFNSTYFGFSEVIYGYKDTITLKSCFIKFLIPVIFTVFVYFFTRSTLTTLSSVFWGSLLIVAPPFLNKECLDYRLLNRVNILRFIYIMFVALNYVLSIVTIKFLKLSSTLVSGYFNQFESRQACFNHLMDVLIWQLLIVVIAAFIVPLIKTLNKELEKELPIMNDESKV